MWDFGLLCLFRILVSVSKNLEKFLLGKVLRRMRFSLDLVGGYLGLWSNNNIIGFQL